MPCVTLTRNRIELRGPSSPLVAAGSQSFMATRRRTLRKPKGDDVLDGMARALVRLLAAASRVIPQDHWVVFFVTGAP